MLSENVSIIIPIYNVEERILRRTVKSVLNQSYKNWELILVDDGSNSKLAEVYDGFSDNNIRVIHKCNGGVSSARNRGLDEAKYEYICFVDADDILHRDYLKRMLERLVSENADICICCCSYVTDNYYTFSNTKSDRVVSIGKQKALENLFYMHKYFEGNEFTAVWGRIYKRKCIGNIRFDERMSLGEDFVFNYYCFKRTKKVVLLESSLYGYVTESLGLMRGSYSHDRINTLNGLADLRKNASEEDLDGIISRSINIELTLLLKIPINEYSEDRKLIIAKINEDRKRVLRNKKTRNKVRIALILSYFGYDRMQLIFQRISKKVKK